VRADEHDLYRDELAERRRERDRHREPGRWRRPVPDHRARQAFQARVVDIANATAITALECPACGGPVFALAGSVDERVDCVNEGVDGPCDARLIAIQTAAGVAVVLAPGGAP